MSQKLSSKLALLAGEPTHYCPGCEQLHRIPVNKPQSSNGCQWSWNGDVENPSFSPSINIVGRCHYFIRNGNIEFCADSKHALSGKTVPLPDIPEDWL